MSKKVEIKNRSTGKVYKVTEREWENINKNEDVSQLYTVVNAPVHEPITKSQKINDSL